MWIAILILSIIAIILVIALVMVSYQNRVHERMMNMYNKQSNEWEQRHQTQQELLEVLYPLIDSINKNDPDKDYPPVDELMPYVNGRLAKYWDETFGRPSAFTEATKL